MSPRRATLSSTSSIIPAAKPQPPTGNRFQDDPEWKSVKDKSEANGKLVDKVDSTYLALTDFSPPLR